MSDTKFPIYLTPAMAGEQRNNGLRLAAIKIISELESSYVFDDGKNFGITHKKTESEIEGKKIMETYLDKARYAEIEIAEYEQLLSYVVMKCTELTY